MLLIDDSWHHGAFANVISAIVDEARKWFAPLPRRARAGKGALAQFRA